MEPLDAYLSHLNHIIWGLGSSDSLLYNAQSAQDCICTSILNYQRSGGENH